MSAGWSIWAGLVATPLMIAAGQVLFKITGARLVASEQNGFLRLLLDPYLLSALAIYGLATLVWVHVLSHLPLSQAYPFMAFTFLLVPLASILVLQETVAAGYWVGAGLIICGTIVISISS